MINLKVTLPIDRIQTYYDHPGQTILRREVAWTLNYFFRSRGVLWIIGWVALLQGISILLPYLLSIGLARPWISPLLTAIGFMPLLVIKVPLWFHLVNRRVLLPFRADRRGETLATPLQGKDFWPGLLAAPVCGLLILNLTWYVIGIIRHIFHLLKMYMAPISPGAEQTETIIHTLAVQIFINIPVGLFLSAILLLAITALTARFAIPKPTFLRIVLPPAILLLIVHGIQSLFQWGYISMMTQERMWFAEYALYFSYLALLLSHVPAFLIYIKTLHTLRSPSFRHQLLRDSP